MPGGHWGQHWSHSALPRDLPRRCQPGLSGQQLLGHKLFLDRLLGSVVTGGRSVCFPSPAQPRNVEADVLGSWCTCEIRELGSPPTAGDLAWGEEMGAGWEAEGMGSNPEL